MSTVKHIELQLLYERCYSIQIKIIIIIITIIIVNK